MKYGATDPMGYEAVDGRLSTHDWHATILRIMGIDHEKLTYNYAGRDFRLTDEEYDAFVNWLDGKDYEYTTQVEKALEDLDELAKKEKYHEAINEELESLISKMSRSKKEDLLTFKEEIQTVLEEEIIGRYYYQSGIVEASFRTDSDIQKAIEVLRDQDSYKETLSARNQE